MRTLSASAVLAGLFLCVSAAGAAAQVPGPHVAMSITLPDGTAKQFTVPESGLATVTLQGREYGFRPTMHDDAGTRMTVTVFDMGSASEAAREIGAVDVRGGAAAVALKGTPAFKVQARKAAMPSAS